ncbi:putative repeat protein (TIGR01451 family) [Roseiarcus fermentans]|uniref:Putative repeat protein (TIGR01451 family) n=1 Tax=Roseiarcus fermentans TaxID=1473586 RepID=A0A366EY55_9HYPH|nr:DUF11 domain-containing protein [Roseiarcus fermentans]RBP06395.1 putative repeat protein (TIGR01451 family) [Roseiarcus fermentans]
MTDISDSSTPSVATDQPDYAPGSEAIFTATGFDPNSTIEFQVQILQPDGTYSAPVAWFATASDTGDVSTPFLVDYTYANTSDLLTATEVTLNPDGSVTAVGPSASTPFTDSASNSLTITKTFTTTPQDVADVDANGGEADTAGQVIHYTVTVKNTGTGLLTGVAVTDALSGALTGSVALTGGASVLTPGSTETLTGSLTVTQAEIDAGVAIVNTASVTDAQSVKGSSTVTTTIAQHPGLSLTKSVAASAATYAGDAAGSVDAAGQTLTYTIVAKNTGNETLTNVVVTDPMDPTAGNVVGTIAALGVGQSQTLTFTVAATQAEIDAGAAIANTASGADDQNAPATSNTVTTSVDQHGGLSLTKSVSTTPSLAGDAAGSVDAAGQTLTYTIVAKNTGNETLTNVVVTDPMDPTAGTVVGTIAALGVGQSQTLTFTVAATQAEIDAGTAIANTASGADDQNAPATSNTVTTSVDQHGGLSLTKSVSTTPSLAGDAAGSVDAAGQTLTYTIVAENTGNETLTNVVVTDPMDPTAGNVVGTIAALGVGQSQTLTFTVAATQAEIDAGTAIANTASGADDQNAPATSNTVTTSVDQHGGLSLTKSVSTTPSLAGDAAGSVDAAGQTLTYTIVAKNTGNETLTNVVVTDPMDPTAGNVVGTIAALGVGQSQTLTFTVAATQAEIDAGTAIANTASGADDQNAPATSNTVTTSVDQHGGLSLTKSVSTTPSLAGDAAGSVDAAGQTLTYTIVAENTGNETLTNVVVTDPMDPTAGTVVGTIASLGAGQSQTLTFTVAATQAEIDAGTAIANTATATDTQNAPATSNTVTTSVDQHGGLSLTKSVSTTPSLAGDAAGSVDAAGQTLTYTIVAKNTGNETLTNVVVTDPMDPTAGNVVGTIAALGVGQSQTLTFTVAATQAEIDAGTAIANTASGADDQNAPATSNTVTTSVDQHGGLSLTKSVSTTPSLAGDAAGSVDAAGQTLTYTIVAKNTGNETLTNVVVTDPMDPTVGNVVGTIAALGVGQSQTLTFTVAATQAEIDAGTAIANTAAATDAQNAPATSNTVTTSVDQHGGLSLTKSVSTTPSLAGDAAGSVDAAGQTLTYTIVAKNTGNETLTNVVVTDPMDPTAGNVVGTIAALGVGQSQTLTFTVAATQAEIDAGTAIANTAAATDAQNAPATSNTVTTFVDQHPGLSLVKSVATSAPVYSGDAANSIDSATQTLTYTIVAKNTGNETLTNVVVTDPMDPTAGNVVGTIASLGVGQSQTLTFTVAATQAEINAGTAIANTATATDAQNAPATSNTVYTPVEQHKPASLSLAKTVTSITEPGSGSHGCGTSGSGTTTLSPGSKAVAGDTINYSIVATNTGGVTLTGLTVVDPLTGKTLISGASLAAGATDTFTTSYTVTAQDMSNDGNPAGSGDIVNTATATDNQTSAVAASATTVLNYAPGLSLTKVVTSISDSSNSGCGPGWGGGGSGCGGGGGSDCGDDADWGGGSGCGSSGGSGSASVVDAGDTITYQIVAANTGNVALTNLVIIDALTGAKLASNVTLGVGQSLTYTTSYTITAADMSNDGNPAGSGDIVNVATATDAQTAAVQASATTQITYQPGLQVSMAANPNGSGGCGSSGWGGCGSDGGCGAGSGGVTAVGQTISYAVTVTNTGDVGLTGLTYAYGPVALTGGAATLAVGASETLTGTHVVTQADVDAGSFVSSVTVNDAQNVKQTASATTAIAQTPGLTAVELVSTDGGVNWYAASGGCGGLSNSVISQDTGIAAADLHTGAPVASAGPVEFEVLVVNSGNVDLSSVSVHDSAAGLNVSLASSLLGAGQSEESSIATLTPSQMGATIADTATASGTYDGASVVTASSSASFQTPAATTASRTASGWASASWTGVDPSSSKLVLGDVNGGGVANDGPTNAAETGNHDYNDLTFTASAAKSLLGASGSGDARVAVASQLVAAQMNLYNDLAFDQSHGGLASGYEAAPSGLIEESVLWLTGNDFGTGVASNTDAAANVDVNHNGTLDSSEYNGGAAFTSFSSPALSTSNAAYTTMQDVLAATAAGNWDHLTITANALGLTNALTDFNNGSLVVSSDGSMIGWNNHGAITDVHQNSAGAFWAVLYDQHVAGVSHA